MLRVQLPLRPCAAQCDLALAGWCYGAVEGSSQLLASCCRVGEVGLVSLPGPVPCGVGG